ASHHMVIQDDVIVSPDFLAAAKVAADLFPSHPVSFFDLSKAPKQALEKDKHWVIRRTLSTGLAVMMPSAMALDVVRWVDGRFRPEIQHDDARLSWYFLAHNVEV